MIDYAGAAVGAAFGELLGLVKHLVKTVAAFRGQLKKIRTTLRDIEPIIKDIDKYNRLLKRGPKEMAPIKDLLEEGKALVDKCSKIQALDLGTRYTHSKKLTYFNAAVVEKFQLYIPLLNARDGKEVLVDVKEIRGEVKEVKDLLISAIWYSGVFQRGPEALGDVAGPAAPNFIVGSEAEASSTSRKLNKVEISEVATEDEAVHEISTADSQQFDFGTVRAATEPFELGTLGASNKSAKKFQTSVGRSLFAMLPKMKWKKKQRRQSVEGEFDEISTVDSQQFNFDTIRAATDDFADSKKLGQGGFGAVYRGRLSNGQEIAVKRLSQNSHQGEVEFKNEVMLLTRLQHRNLIRLLGFCLKGVERLLIYELMPNPSLDQFIFDPLKRVNLNWDRLHKIVMGVARGLLYLHEDSRLRIIHRDLKASNILLDSDMNPKISDLGLARLLELDQTQAETSRIVGTYGYMAPEYAMHGKFSVKSDVFSFGVLVLEIVSGQRNNLCRMGKDTVALTSYVWKKWREGSISDIIDPSITSGSSTEIARCIHIGLLCVQENFASRPSMASVFLMLNSHSVTLQAPSRPAFFIDSANEFDMSSTQDYSSRVSNVERSRGRSNQFSKNEACMTQDYSSSISNVDRSRGRSNQFSKNEASMTQDYSSRVSDVERSKGKSNQFSENKTSMTEPHGSLRKWETSVPCSLLFMFVVVFLSSMLQKKLSFCA
ncbi:cold-responsive protein kinase 1-like isoform X5 [Rhodamnia argentea]|uniref:Cold-responsive protein kinase 1-like isoform X5 n=1 Tax=Rhodamnia argentea TaxID=178133 RepID=A0ABM3H8H2_9MYRT|nr:cold-responsive protein kinase 1-like isoform X5 [Rhodamnia argentea]